MRGCGPLLCLSLLVAAPAALAQGSGQTDDELAKQYYNLGEKLYNRSDYEGALKQFQQAYNYSKRPALYYNMARCYEFMSKLEQAIAHYEKFLESKPKNEPEVRARIANLRKRLEPSKPAPTPATRPTSAPPPTPKAQPPQPVQPQPQPAKPAPRPERSRWMGTLGWVTAGAGGAILVTGAILGVLAGKKAREVEDNSTKRLEWVDSKKTWDDGQALENMQIMTLALGAAAVAGGVLLIYLDHRAEKEHRRAWLAPTVTPGGAAVSGGFQF
jgi:tetratricopeptide (TPR) repeat protein